MALSDPSLLFLNAFISPGCNEKKTISDTDTTAETNTNRTSAPITMGYGIPSELIFAMK
jgi:hypothetical protein